MPVTPTYPGVYVQEVPSGVRTIVGVSTSIGMFLGMADQGPMFGPREFTNYTDFVRTFGDNTATTQMANYVRMFFLNGGTDCYVMRIANGATQASVTLQNEAGVGVLVLTARDAGLSGENIRALVTYSGPLPETTFNLNLFQWVIDSGGNRVKANAESWQNLSMDPTSPLYAPTFITQSSKLVTAAVAATLPAAVTGYSLSGRAVADGPAFAANWTPLIGTAAPANTSHLQMSVNNSALVDVDVSGIIVATEAGLILDLQKAIHDAFNAKGIPGVNVVVTFPAAGPANTVRLKFTAPAGDVYIQPGAIKDITVPLMLGTSQGGLEVSGFALQRPAPNGISSQPTETTLDAFAALTQGGLASIDIDVMQPTGVFIAGTVMMTGGPLPSIITGVAGDSMDKDANGSSPNGNSDGIREKLRIIAQRLSQFAPAGAINKWTVSVANYRLTLTPTSDLADNFVATHFNAGALAPYFPNPANVHYYTVGVGGASIGRQTSAVAIASDGIPPLPADYDKAYPIIDKEVDLFNLMVLPPDTPARDMSQFYADASVFCQQRRAFLLMDPPPSWQSATDAKTGIAGLRTSLIKDYSALFYPRITVVDNTTQSHLDIGPAGAIAGLCARIDGTRGVWKAPAGTEATINGITALEQKFSNNEQGLLNPHAINVLRVFPSGIVNFGARTMDGDDGFASEYKYIPVRRLALFLEESLYRGLQWVVFEPNDEPLWAQIRLNVGAFMHDQFRKGAFQGATPSQAYFVKCDGETTTQTDRNLGIVNIWVGFAPLNPAEFVILYLQQMAGQIQV
jgi:phage tail sheath protein FI